MVDQLARTEQITELERQLASAQNYLENTTKSYRRSARCVGQDAHKKTWEFEERMNRYKATIERLEKELSEARGSLPEGYNSPNVALNGFGLDLDIMATRSRTVEAEQPDEPPHGTLADSSRSILPPVGN
jgi:hypothetical protein